VLAGLFLVRFTRNSALSWRRPRRHGRCLTRDMRSRFALLALLTLLSPAACATARGNGAALVGTGLAVAVISSAVATEHTTCSLQACSRSTSRNSGAAAAGVAAAVALAAVGAAMASDDRGDAPRPRGTTASSQAGPPRGWRLVRPPDNAGEAGATDAP
jgi:hypothetical protein